MHAEYHHTEQRDSFDVSPNTELFSDAGIGPSGECWVVPTENFLRIWESPAGAYIKDRGFRMRNNGKQLGASQDRVLIVLSHRKGGNP
ncbi:hypothetical protein C6503_19390 [Candidatus Poribacteria bacterium]|nr:MAG: hypothetical protein C6503_19390 [Candidatus Poribacteria bacterium]